MFFNDMVHGRGWAAAPAVGLRGLTLYVEQVDNELATDAQPIWFCGRSV